MNIGYVLAQRADLGSDRIAIHYAGDDLTYRELHRQVNRLANGLLSLGVRRGDRVSILARNCPDYYVALFACGRIGAVLNPLNWRLSVPELAFILTDAGSAVLIYDPQFAQTVSTLRPNLPEWCRLVVLGKEAGDSGAAAYIGLLAGASDTSPGGTVDVEDDLLILYTSGTTGRPKGALITHGNALWNSLHQVIDLNLKAQDSTLVICPQFHASGLFNISLPLLTVGGRLVIMRSFDSGSAMVALDRHRITTLFAVPTMIQAMLERDDMALYDTSCLRLILSGGSPFPVPVMEKIFRTFKAQFCQGYGLTEGTSVSTFLRSEYALTKIGSIGKPFTHVELQVVDGEGRPVPPGQVGEIVTRGVSVSRGYWKRPEATAEAWRGGWFHTGDQARIDAEGFIYIAGRKNDMIISGGENIYPAEVEQVLFAHPAVLEAAVVGAPDARWGEMVRAVIVLRTGMNPGAREIIFHCRSNLAPYKVPKYVEFVDQLPRNLSGKVLKSEVRRQFQRPADDD